MLLSRGKDRICAIFLPEGIRAARGPKERHDMNKTKKAVVSVCGKAPSRAVAGCLKGVVYVISTMNAHSLKIKK